MAFWLCSQYHVVFFMPVCFVVWYWNKVWYDMICMISSSVSHSDGSCVLGRIHSDVSLNIPKKVYHIVTDNFVNLLHISYAWLYKTEYWGRKFHAFSFNSHRNCKIFVTNFNFLYSIQFAYPTYSGSPFSDEIAIMIRHYVIHPYLKIRHYVIHPTIWYTRVVLILSK